MNLFGYNEDDNKNNTIELNLYCDEIKESEINDNNSGKEKWAYIGILIVPTHLEKELLNNLLKYRCRDLNSDISWKKCKDDCKFHTKNDLEVHYQGLNSKNEYFIADRWLDFFLNDTTQTYFYIFGIDLLNLDYSTFGESKGNDKFNTIYNRLFRTAIKKSIKTYFSKYKSIIVKNIFHDNSDLENHKYFPWHCIYKLDKDDEKLFFSCDKIDFIDSDHNKSKNLRSNLIQYIDLLLGLSFNALHFSSRDDNKVKLTERYLPVLERIMKEPRNINSRYKHYNRLGIDFFPKHKISNLSEAEKEFVKYDSFYKEREIRIYRKNQKTLFD